MSFNILSYLIQAKILGKLKQYTLYSIQYNNISKNETVTLVLPFNGISLTCLID